MSRKKYTPFYFLAFLSFIFTIYLIFLERVSFSFIFVPLIFAAIVIKGTEIHRLGHKYELNNRSVVHTRGYLLANSRRIDLFAISDIIITQSFLQRVLNFGDIHIRLFSVESTNTLKNINRPHQFAQKIEEQMYEARGVGNQTPDWTTVEVLG